MEQSMSRDTLLRLSELPTGAPTAFRVEPDAETRARIASELGIDALRKVRLEGTLTPHGKRDWALSAHLGATVVQPCVVTLAPVTTRIEDDLARLYLADYVEPVEGGEHEMPEDDTTEALPELLDLETVLTEALALGLPAYPRADDAALDTAVFTEPGKAPMTDEDARPFAGLASLRDKLAKDD